MINVNGATPRNAGQGKLEPDVVQMLREREISEGQVWVDFTNDPAVCVLSWFV